MKYIAVIHKEDSSEFGVSFPDFPGCITGDRTFKGALRKAQEALEFHVDGMKEDGVPLPIPTSWEKIMADPEYAGAAFFHITVKHYIAREKIRVNISIPADRLEAIDHNAREAGLSRSAYIIEKCS